jgi:hypothetical protein
VLNSQQHSEKEKDKRERKMNEYFLLLQMCGVLVFLSHMHEWVEKGF